MLYKICFLCFFISLLNSCNEDENDTTSITQDNTPISMESFEQEVINLAGALAIDCGKVEINESSLTVNMCVSDSFIINASFYSFYVVQGIDSHVAHAISMDSNNVVKYWSYDSYGEGSISSKICKTPSATSKFTGSHSEIFNCSE